MCVQVDDARHQREPAGIDDLGRVLASLADRSDAAIPDCNVSADRIMPQSIHHGGAADHDVMHRHLLGCLLSKTLVLYCSNWTCGLSCGPACVNSLDQTRDGSTAISGRNTRL